jgi:hypothetical protein
MPSRLSRVRRASGRVFTACVQLLSRALRLLFILGLMALPVPVVSVLVGLLRSSRRQSVPTQVLRKK